MEHKYIDADELMRKFTFTEDGRKIPVVDASNFPVTLSITEIQKIIREMPAADVEPMRHDQINQIADFYGWRHQRDKAIEECGELIVALEKIGPDLRPSRPESEIAAVVTELADVEIMVRQIAYLMNAEAATRLEIRRKLDRQIERMKEAGKDNG